MAHVPALAAVHAAAFAPGETWDARAIAGLLALPGTTGLLGVGGEAMALFRVAADEAELLTLAVHPACRRQGWGAALVEAVAAGAQAGGAAALFLEVSAANAPALSLYGGAGFVRSGHRPRYYADGSDAVLMTRLLRPVCGS